MPFVLGALNRLGARWTGPVMMAGLTVFLASCSIPPKATIPARAFQGLTRVACVGDSITAGAGLADPGSSAYPAVLGRLLGPAYEVRNFGVSGTTLSRDGDHPFWDTPSLLEARLYEPHVVVIALGTNDSKPQNWRYRNGFARDLYALAWAFETLPSRPTVYLCTPLPVFETRWGINEAVVGGILRPQIREIGARELWPVIDLHSVFRNQATLFPDGVHPNEEGAAAIAAFVEAAFRGK